MSEIQIVTTKCRKCGADRAHQLYMDTHGEEKQFYHANAVQCLSCGYKLNLNEKH